MSIETITKADFVFRVYTFSDVPKCPAYDGKYPFSTMIVLAETDGADGLSWESFEQFWADYGMVRMGLDLGKMNEAAQSLFKANDPLEKLKAKVGEQDLDDLVHDLASSIGTAANNEGVDGQVAFIVEQVGKERAIKEIEATLNRPES